ncbi:MAG: TIM barrel protein [Planctomycetota bacterium]
MRFALPSSLLAGSLRAALPRLAEAGVEGVRLDLRTELRAADLSATAIRELRHRLSEHGLTAGPAVFPTRGALHEEDRLDERLAGITAALNLAAELGCRTLSFRRFRLPDEDDPQSALLTQALNDLARAGSHVGVIPCLSTGGQADRLHAVLSSVTTGPVGVNFDPAAVLLSGGDPVRVAGLHRERIQSLTTRDVILDDGEDSGGREVPVGRGEVDWEQTLASLSDAHDFARSGRGWVVCDRTGGPDPFGDAARAASYLRAVASP